MKCKDVTFLISKQQDEGISWWENMQVKAHLCICPRCRTFARNNQRLQQLTQDFVQHLDSSPEKTSSPHAPTSDNV